MIRLKVVVVLMLLRVARAWWFCLRSNGRSNWSRSLGNLGALAGDWRVVVIYPCLVNYYAQTKGSERDNNRVSEVDPGPCSLPRGCSPHLIVALYMTISQPFQYLIGPSHILTKRNPVTSKSSHIKIHHNGRPSTPTPLPLPPLPARDADPHPLHPRQPVSRAKAHPHRHRHSIVCRLSFSRSPTANQVRRVKTAGSRADLAIRPAAAPLLYAG